MVLQEEAGAAATPPSEYVAPVGGSTTGTIEDIGHLANIKISGTGAGGDGTTNHPGSCCPGKGGGGGAASNPEGNTFPIPGNSITSIYYSVGGSNGADTFIK